MKIQDTDLKILEILSHAAPLGDYKEYVYCTDNGSMFTLAMCPEKAKFGSVFDVRLVSEDQNLLVVRNATFLGEL